MRQLFLSTHSSSIKTEVIAGLTTFLTMVYIVFVNPTILSQAGMDKGAVFTATCLVSALGCILTGVLANSPIAVAPGMALNVFFTYSVVLGQGATWQQALAMVFVSGLCFFIVTLTPLRRLLIEALPDNLQIAILVGISFLIALITLNNNGIVTHDAYHLLSLSEITKPQSLLFFLGFLIILILDLYAIKGAIILGILSISLLSLGLGLTHWQGVMATPPSLVKTLGALDFQGFFTVSILKATFTFFLITVFDATGTLVGLMNQSLFKSDETLNQSLKADALASIAAGFLGSSSTSPYIESASGIQAGGRTGLTTLVVGLGFLLVLFFYPLAQMIPSFAVGPALLYVACCMMRHMSILKLNDMTEVAPAALTMLLIPFTMSIADGIGAGLICYTVLKLATRQRVQALTFMLSMIFIFFFMMH